MSNPIGVFDSGYGGLTILKEIVKELPEYDYIYLGDNARTPYGTRSFDLVYKYTKEALFKLHELGCRLVIIACNTASAKALRSIQQNDLPLMNDPDFRVLGVIRPSVEILADVTENGHIGIMATNGTVNSHSYVIEVDKIHAGKNFTVTQQACPMWVPIVENNEIESEGSEYFVRKYLNQISEKDPLIDTIVLACTHYPLLKKVIDKNVKEGITVMQQGELVAKSLKDYLKRHPEKEQNLTKNKARKYYTTERNGPFDEMASLFMQENVNSEYIEL